MSFTPDKLELKDPPHTRAKMLCKDEHNLYKNIVSSPNPSH